MSVITIIVTIFVTLNPLGNIPVFVAMLKDFSPERQRVIITRELTFSLLILLLFSFCGDYILGAFDLNIPILRIAGGMLLSLIALGMLFPKPQSSEALKQEPFLVPLAIPIVTGPASISTVMVFSHEVQNQWIMFLGIMGAWIPSIISLLLSSFLKRVLGERMLVAFEQIFGMVLMFISAQMVSVGIKEFTLEYILK